MSSPKFSAMVKKILPTTILVLLAANLFIWRPIIFANDALGTKLYFLNVGQGDSQLALIDGIKVLIDGGPGPQVVNQLDKILLPHDRYIDLMILTHPQLDHFGGLIDVLRSYQVGAVITSGRSGTTKAFVEFQKAIRESGVRHLVLRQGDIITYRDSFLKILSPSSKNAQDPELNNTSLVIMLEKMGLRALYTGDIGFDIENELLAKYDLSAQVLKVPHHGSRFSSGSVFLKEVNPKVAIIGVGKNSYGHPTAQTLQRLASVGSAVLRTDNDGNIKIIFNQNRLQVFR